MSTAVKKKVFDNRFEIISIIGRGANSVIYLGKSISDPYKDIALKVLTNSKTESNSAERLRTEAIAMVAARHKYVMPLDDFNSVGDISYLSMDYAPGLDLRSFIKSKGTLSVPQATRFFKQIAEALAHLHNEGIIHHDIKPDNILVINDRLVKLTDFGLASLPGQSTQINELQKGVGTLDYMAPEILEGINSGTPSDVYAFALSFYEILTGKNPFANVPIVKAINLRKNNLPHIKDLVPEIEANIAEAIMAGLKYEEQARIQDGNELIAALNNPEFGIILPIDIATPKSEPSPFIDPFSELEEQPEQSNNPFIEPDDTNPSPFIEPTADLIQDPFAEIQDPFAEISAEKNESHSENISSKEAETDNSWDDFLKNLEEPSENKNMDDKKAEDNSEESKDKSWEDFLNSLESEEPKKEVTQSDDDKAWEDFLKSLETDLSEEKPAASKIEVSLKELNSTMPKDFTPEIHLPENNIQQNIQDPFTEIRDVESEEYEHHSRIPTSFESTQQKPSSILPIIKIVCIGLIAFWIIKSVFFSKKEAPTVTAQETTSQPMAINTINNTFPFLEPGIYSGKFSGLTPGRQNILSFVLTNDSKLIFITDLVGWQPVQIDLKNPKLQNGKLTVAGNGYIFKLSASEESGSLKGKFKDESTKSRGEWEITSLSN